MEVKIDVPVCKDCIIDKTSSFIRQNRHETLIVYLNEVDPEVSKVALVGIIDWCVRVVSLMSLFRIKHVFKHVCYRQITSN